MYGEARALIQVDIWCLCLRINKFGSQHKSECLVYLVEYLYNGQIVDHRILDFIDHL